MKRTPLKRKTPMKRGTVALKRTGSLRRGKLRLVGVSTASELKRSIQAVLREIAIKRDGGCVLRHSPEAGACGGYRNDGALILQAEHLLTRSNTATFADTRNIVCICRHHHGHFKPQYSHLYWQLIEEVIGVERWRFLKLAEADRSPHKVDLRLALIVLQHELHTLSTKL